MRNGIIFQTSLRIQHFRANEIIGYDMTGHSRDESDHFPMSFLDSIEEEDHAKFKFVWKELTVEKKETSKQLRLKKPWIRTEESAELAVRETTWILFLALPQLDDEGKLLKIFGCTTDISHFKWAEKVQKNSKEALEEFIDCTS